VPAVPRPAAGDPSARPFAAQELDRALKFARLSPSSVALPSVGENEKGELYLMYQARDMPEICTRYTRALLMCQERAAPRRDQAEAAFQPAGSPLPPSPLAPQANSAAASSPTAQSVADLELLKTVIGISQPQVA